MTQFLTGLLLGSGFTAIILGTLFDHLLTAKDAAASRRGKPRTGAPRKDIVV